MNDVHLQTDDMGSTDCWMPSDLTVRRTMEHDCKSEVLADEGSCGGGFVQLTKIEQHVPQLSLAPHGLQLECWHHILYDARHPAP